MKILASEIQKENITRQYLIGIEGGKTLWIELYQNHDYLTGAFESGWAFREKQDEYVFNQLDMNLRDKLTDFIEDIDITDNKNESEITTDEKGIPVCAECGDILQFEDEFKAGICRGCAWLIGK